MTISCGEKFQAFAKDKRGNSLLARELVGTFKGHSERAVAQTISHFGASGSATELNQAQRNVLGLKIQ